MGLNVLRGQIEIYRNHALQQAVTERRLRRGE
jgi:hypothetical protein